MTTRAKPRRGSRQPTSPYTHEPKPQQEREDGRLPEYNSNGHAVTKGIKPNGESGRRGFSPIHFFKVCWASSCTASKYVNVLWPFVPAAIALVSRPSRASLRFHRVDAVVPALRQTSVAPLDLHLILRCHGASSKFGWFRRSGIGP